MSDIEAPQRRPTYIIMMACEIHKEMVV